MFIFLIIAEDNCLGAGRLTPTCRAANAYVPGLTRHPEMLMAGPWIVSYPPRAGLVPASKDVDVGLRPDGYRGPSAPVRRR